MAAVSVAALVAVEAVASAVEDPAASAEDSTVDFTTDRIFTAAFTADPISTAAVAA